MLEWALFRMTKNFSSVAMWRILDWGAQAGQLLKVWIIFSENVLLQIPENVGQSMSSSHSQMSSAIPPEAMSLWKVMHFDERKDWLKYRQET